MIGDAFGNVAFSTWSCALAGYYAMDDDKRKLEKQYLREMDENTKYNMAKLENMMTDAPTRGTFVTAFKYFDSGCFNIQMVSDSLAAKNNLKLMMATSAEGVKLFLFDRQMHRQTFEFAMRGISEEQIID